MVGVKNEQLVGDLDIFDTEFCKLIEFLDHELGIPVAKHGAAVGKFILLAIDNIDHAKRATHRAA